jgi:hypothetical protein
MIEVIINKQVLLERTWNNEETGVLIIGKNDDDVIEIEGILKAGIKRTKFNLTVINREIDLSIGFIMNPVISELINLFPLAEFDDDVITLTFSVPDLGNLLYVKSIIKSYKI